MENEQVEKLLNEKLGLAEVHVKSEGTHYNIIAVDECFDGLSRVKKQQKIYGPLSALIEDGTIHAVSIKAYTPKEWVREKKFN
ncbi:MAG: BolA family transcriptional regulator [Psychrosphaera sp.]|nr:BolA family transcriptional regulator [Psychrosphaera sp.]